MCQTKHSYKINLKNLRNLSLNCIANFGGVSSKGDSFAVNQHYFLKNNAPWFPVMGEFHFSRYPNAFWEESILKMKAGGVEIIATYVFWIHHEEIEGDFSWAGNLDVGRFVRLCDKHGMKVFLRIGPWAHGECRNGGFPDWLIKKEIALRTNVEEYLGFVKILYSQIYRQIDGLLFKDDGPVIGIQIENEYGHCGGLSGEPGKEHMMMLKSIARQAGFDVPFYTATGWGGGIVVDGEMLPVLGGYADAPWAQHVEELPASREFLFAKPAIATEIGTDLSEIVSYTFTYKLDAYPYLTAELGGGLQVTHHRRPIVKPKDVEIMALVKIGSGANLLGYYMYHGGTNPVGKLSTFQESKDTGYANDLPVLSYDFQAPIGEYGQINASYKFLKVLHMFLCDFGYLLAPTISVIPDDNPKSAEDCEKLRYAVRCSDDSGFLFVSNHQRNCNLSDKENITIEVEHDNGAFVFGNLELYNGEGMILPYNFVLANVRLLTANAQPLCKLSNGKITDYVFWNYEGRNTFYVLSDEGIGKIESEYVIPKSDKQYKVCVSEPGNSSVIKIETVSGELIRIHTIGRKEAENAWKCKVGNEECLFITQASLFSWKDKIQLNSLDERVAISVLNGPDLKTLFKCEFVEYLGKDGELKNYQISCSKVNISARFEEIAEYQDKTKLFNIKLDFDSFEEISDCYLGVDFIGDQARLYIDEKLCADWFYTGIKWEIGLKRFAHKIKDADIKIEILPLDENAYVYLESRPTFKNGLACDLLALELKAEYSFILQKKGSCE